MLHVTLDAWYLRNTGRSLLPWSKLCYTLHWMPGIYVTPVARYCPGDLQGLWRVGPGVSVFPRVV